MKWILYIGFLLLPMVGFADEMVGIGGMAEHLLEPVSVVSDFIGTASIVVGAACLFGSVIRYTQYRVNPLAFPLSTVVVLFIIGVILVLLPFTYKLTGYGIPYPSS